VKENGEKEKEKDKIRSKRVKEVQKRTELRQIGVQKRRVARERKIFIFGKGGGTNIVFGPEYRRLIK
jgi:hypothetical protein